MVQVVEKIKVGLAEYEVYIPMGAYALLIHKTGAGIEAWLKDRGLPSEWAPAVTSLIYALTAYGAEGVFPEYGKYIRPAGHLAMALTILNAALVFWPSSEGKSRTTITKKS